jgi:hypothetical protein
MEIEFDISDQEMLALLEDLADMNTKDDSPRSKFKKKARNRKHRTRITQDWIRKFHPTTRTDDKPPKERVKLELTAFYKCDSILDINLDGAFVISGTMKQIYVIWYQDNPAEEGNVAILGVRPAEGHYIAPLRKFILDGTFGIHFRQDQSIKWLMETLKTNDERWEGMDTGQWCHVGDTLIKLTEEEEDLTFEELTEQPYWDIRSGEVERKLTCKEGVEV